MQMRHEVFSSVRAQTLDTRGYHVSDLKVTEFQWEDIDTILDTVFGPGLGTHFSLSFLNVWDMGLLV